MKNKLVILALVLLFVSCGRQPIDTESTSSWKTPLGSYYGTSFSMKNPEPPLGKVWERRLSAYSKYSPVTAGAAVVCADNSGKLYCIDAATSQDIWTEEFSPGQSMQPVIGNNAVIFCDGSPTIYSLNINNGQANWSFKLPDNAAGYPLYGDGKVWVCAGKSLFCFEESKGALIFSKEYPEAFTQAPTMQRYLYLVAGKKIIAVSAENGQMTWERSLPKDIISPICCSRSEIFAVDGSLWKIDDNTGNILQSYTNDLFMDNKTGGWNKVPSLEGPLTSGVALYVNMLAVGTQKGEILGFQISDISHFVLYHRANMAITSTPLITPKYVWFTTPDFKDTGRFFCIANQLDAKWVWHDWYNESVSSHPAVTEDAFYVLTDKGLLTRYGTGGKPVDPSEDSKRMLDKKEESKKDK